MNHREAHFIACRVRDMLNQRGALRRGAAQFNINDFIAAEIIEAQPAFQQAEDFRQASNIADGIRTLKRTVREIVPPSFGWWIEVDHEVRVSIRWLWLGHPAVTHSGSITDDDISIVLHLLRSVDWSAEATAAMANVEEAEVKLLRIAQQSRRLKLSDSAHLLATLPPVELPAPVPVALIEKQKEKGPLEIPRRMESRAEMESRMARVLSDHKEQRAAHKGAVQEYRDERFQPVQWSLQGMPADAETKRREEFAAALAQAAAVADAAEEDDEAPDPDEDEDEDEDETPELDAKPTRRARSVTPPPAPTPDPALSAAPVVRLAPIPTGARRPRFIDEEGKPRIQFGLSRDKSRGPVSLMKFEPFDTLAELIQAVQASDAGTYSQAFLHGGNSRISGAAEVWQAFGHPQPPEPAQTPTQRHAWHG